MTGRPLIRIRLVLADGEELVYENTGLTLPPTWLLNAPDWLYDKRKSWATPQDPVTFEARVRPGHEDDARALLEEGEPA